MTAAQKLEKLIEKATKNGWKDAWEFDEYHPYEIIFNHDFLKALFGEEFKSYTIAWYKLEGEHMKDPDDFVAQHHYIKAWEFYGMQALISSDPVNYLYKQAIGDSN